MIDGGAAAEPLGHALHVDGEVGGRHGQDPRLHIHRLAGMQTRRDRRIEDRFDHEHEFAPALLAVDDRRRVFRPRRNETHGARDRFGDPVDEDAKTITGVNRADLCFGDECPYFDIAGRKENDHRPVRPGPIRLRDTGYRKRAHRAAPLDVFAPSPIPPF